MDKESDQVPYIVEKNSLCYNLLKKGLGTHTQSYETVQWLVNAIIVE
jgi:hypothetical protein